MAIILALLTLLSGALARDSFDYCMPSNSSCWPTDEEWGELKSSLSSPDLLHYIGDSGDYSKSCSASGEDSAYDLQDKGEGRCMQYSDCAKDKCDDKSSWNIPAYSVEVATENDIVKAIEFANEHDIQVVVKASGHNYAGASMGAGALLIWMRSFEKYTDAGPISNYTRCGKTYDAAIKVGGGQNWKEVYTAVGNDYHVIGGGGLTVGAAGGWLMGGGLSASARLYGMGVDQVLDFRVVLANGDVIDVSECENPDLFWALRGGGGGTFGVVTAIHYQLHETLPFCEIGWYVSDFTEDNDYPTTTVYKWIDYLVDSIPTLDRKWGGYWTFSYAIFYYQGTEAELENDAFYKGAIALGNIAVYTKRCAESYYAARGGPDNLVTDETGHATINIASRLIPLSYARDQPDTVKDTFKWMVNNGFSTFNYIIGGAMSDVPAGNTSVHPAMRESVFQMETFADNMIQKLRDTFPDSGAGFNHAAANEPDWENQLWGDSREELEELKEEWDPDNRFNCWHCVGYIAGESAGTRVSVGVVLVVMTVLEILM